MSIWGCSMKFRLFLLSFATLIASCQTSSEPIAFGGNTIVFYDGKHGIQVEYYSASGRSHLWYPGNDRSIPGRWRLRSDRNEVCFKLPSNVYNPVTNKQLGSWDCKSLDRLKRNVRSSCSGDPFRLAGGKIPFVLEKGRGQLGELKKTCS